MNVDVKWLDIDSDPIFNDLLVESLNNIKKKEYIESISAIISKRANSRHIIDLKIKTTNPDEYLYTSGNAFNLDYSLANLETNLKKVMKEYNPNEYERKQKLKEEMLRQQELNRKIKEEKIKKELMSKEEYKKRKAKEAEQARLKKAEERNAQILKKLEQKRKLEEEQEKAILQELEEHKKKLEEEIKEEALKRAKIVEELSNSNQEIEKDLKEDEKVKSEIKESKDKLRDLWAEENEALVIVDQIKEWSKKEFSSKYYKINEPFELIPGRPIYHDGLENYFIVGESGEWEPFNEINQEFEVFKHNKLQQLEEKLIIARAKRKHHITDLVDEGEIAERLKESKQILKQKELEQKKELQELKKDQKLISELAKNEMKMKASDVIEDIDVVETHLANEPFEVRPGIFAYHDGEGNYFYQNPTTQEWVPTTKSYIYYDNSILNLKLVEEHPANETFQNVKGIYFYHDGNGKYFKNIDDQWVPSTYEECYPKRSKLIKKRRKEKFDDSSDTSYADVVQKANMKIEEIKNQNIEGNSFSSNDVTSSIDVSNDSNQTSDSTTYSQQLTQWQDESTGVWWYMDEQGNYFYADETGNWVPYSG